MFCSVPVVQVKQSIDSSLTDNNVLVPAVPQIEQPKKKSKRILELDALRAISCLNLLLFHFTYVYQNKYGFESPLGFAFPYGKYGVQLFFMLSGLVNAMTLLSKRKPGDFMAARCIRIFPSYWLMIASKLRAIRLHANVSHVANERKHIRKRHHHASIVRVRKHGAGDLDFAG